MDGWKVGIPVFFVGMAYSQGRTVSFRECKPLFLGGVGYLGGTSHDGTHVYLYEIVVERIHPFGLANNSPPFFFFGRGQV